MNTEIYSGLRGLNTYNDRVSIPDLIILPQPRATFTGIEELAENIRENGLVNALLVAEYERDTFKRHLEIINNCWGTDFDLQEFSPNKEAEGEPRFRVLIAGERRTRAIKQLPKSALYQNGAPAQVITDSDPFRVLDFQFIENRHQSPPPHEEARGLANYFRVRKERNPDLTKAEYARFVGCSPQTVRNALRFIDLPSTIQQYVKDDTIAYGIAIELARLQEEGCSEKELKRWMTQAILNRQTVEEFHDAVSEFITHKRNGQGALFTQTEEEVHDARRRTVEREGLEYRWLMIHYNRRVLELFDKGLLGEKDSPYAKGSVIRTVLAQVEELEELIPHAKDLLPQKQAEKFEKRVREARRQISLLLELTPDKEERERMKMP